MSNEEAIERVTIIKTYGGMTIPVAMRDIEALDMAIKALEEERPTGEWIETAKEYYEAVNERGGGVDEHTSYFVDDIACPKCLTKFSTIDNETERFNFCPNCGAKMKEDSKDEVSN